ncbi:type II toxin-antitoxin system YafQ family toxin [Candidatus Saccharibacteria bacterium]|nr:MAG: type II toxin-antitoxin system YafQ family toxin [Candidatus Saccharibacteria bacterium]
MQVDFTKEFDKQFAKLTRPKQLRAKAALALYLENPAAPALRLHRLKGEWAGYCSISAGGDLRLHFLAFTADTLLFVAIGTHSQLYK